MGLIINREWEAYSAPEVEPRMSCSSEQNSRFQAVDNMMAIFSDGI